MGRILLSVVSSLALKHSQRASPACSVLTVVLKEIKAPGEIVSWFGLEPNLQKLYLALWKPRPELTKVYL